MLRPFGAAAAAFALFLVLAAGAASATSVTDGQLHIDAAVLNLPVGCNDANQAAGRVAVARRPDSGMLHEAARLYQVCAASRYTALRPELRNQLLLAAGASLLLAARGEAGTASRDDAAAAAELAARVAPVEPFAGGTHPVAQRSGGYVTYAIGNPEGHAAPRVSAYATEARLVRDAALAQIASLPPG